MYTLDEEVTKTIISSEMFDRSQFCEFEWFEWMMFQDDMASYPDDHFRLGRYLGLSIDIDLTLVAKIIKANHQVLHRSTYQTLTQGEWKQEECKVESSCSWSSVTRGFALALW